MSSPVVLITGALTGIGRATALAFAHEGARVVVSGRHDDEGQSIPPTRMTLDGCGAFSTKGIELADALSNYHSVFP
jgi:NAD(P)-dependent dehydrogenase (short-subunit alcohol dehydrogenase family)